MERDPEAMQQTGTLTRKQEDTIDSIATDSAKWSEKVLKSLSFWREKKKTHEANLEAFKSRLSTEHQATIRKIDPFVLKDMVNASGAIDSEYVEHFLCGFPVTGVIHGGGTGETIPGGQGPHGRPSRTGPRNG